MRKLLIPIAALILGATALAGATTAAAASPKADFGQCIAQMAQSGPDDHAAMMGVANFGEVVKHCQAMHDPPSSR